MIIIRICSTIGGCSSMPSTGCRTCQICFEALRCIIILTPCNAAPQWNTGASPNLHLPYTGFCGMPALACYRYLCRGALRPCNCFRDELATTLSAHQLHRWPVNSVPPKKISQGPGFPVTMVPVMSVLLGGQPDAQQGAAHRTAVLFGTHKTLCIPCMEVQEPLRIRSSALRA